MTNAQAKQLDTFRHLFASLSLQYPALELIVAFCPDAMPKPLWDDDKEPDKRLSSDPLWNLTDERVGPTFMPALPDNDPSSAGNIELPTIVFPSWNFRYRDNYRTVFQLGIWAYWLRRCFGLMRYREQVFSEAERKENLKCLQAYGPLLFHVG